MNAPTKIDDATREAYRINERAKAAARDVTKHRAIINGTAYMALRIVQREVLETALRYRDYRHSWGEIEARPHKVALLALIRVRRELRSTYPNAKPYWEQVA